MNQNHKYKPNTLDIYRRRMRFTQRRIAQVLNLHPSTWSQWERCRQLPSLENALRLGIILRVPVEFLFYAFYDELRNEIRAEEERLDRPIQQALF